MAMFLMLFQSPLWLEMHQAGLIMFIPTDKKLLNIQQIIHWNSFESKQKKIIAIWVRDIEFWIVFVIENSIKLQKWFWKEKFVG
jgi:hypothetical protein